jgi:hypothetical protein
MTRVDLCCLLLITASGCGGGSGASPSIPNPTPTPITLTPPVLTTPPEGAVFGQNDPATGCEYNEAAGYGFQVFYGWEPGPGSFGIESYHLYVKHPSVTLAVVDVYVSVTRYLDRNCGTYVSHHGLNGWEWKVQARGTDGSLGPWSQIRTLNFNQCRLASGRPCGT